MEYFQESQKRKYFSTLSRPFLLFSPVPLFLQCSKLYHDHCPISNYFFFYSDAKRYFVTVLKPIATDTLKDRCIHKLYLRNLDQTMGFIVTHSLQPSCRTFIRYQGNYWTRETYLRVEVRLVVAGRRRLLRRERHRVVADVVFHSLEPWLLCLVEWVKLEVLQEK